MFKKTSSIDFLKYGEVFTVHSDNKEPYENNHLLNIVNDAITYYYYANDEVYIKTLDGIALLVITDDLSKETYEEFVVHRVVKINRNTYFNFVPLGKSALVELAMAPFCEIKNCFSPRVYQHKRITSNIRVNELIAYYYNIRSADYCFSGEKDDFWEITYVDSGVLYTRIDNKTYELHNNEMILYAPKQFHTQWTESSSCSYLSIILDMDVISKLESSALTNQVFTVDRDIKAAIDKFVEASTKEMEFSNCVLISSLERIIVGLLSYSESSKSKIASTPMQQNFENELLNQIIVYIGENIFSNFNNVEELCQHFGLSRSSLQNLFKNNLNIAPKRYILNMKLKKSKELINESKYTVSEIAGLLGFSSIHYFSRRFKQEFGISPTDYANKIYKEK
ncbi:MAG: AraC family transcriptional regulator [Bacillota bacterium]|nr:AraC family transcriptional regulator [Bacillota bacterium]